MLVGFIGIAIGLIILIVQNNNNTKNNSNGNKRKRVQSKVFKFRKDIH